MEHLRGGTAIVTGASRGLGTYIARALAREGMDVVLAARSVDGLEATAAEIRRLGVRASTVPTDVTDPAARAALVEAALREHGRVDLLVNNAGLVAVAQLVEMPPEQVDALIDVNLRASVHLTRLVLPHLLAARRGHVVNIASLSGLVGTPYMSLYSTTKFGLVGFTRALRHELRGSGVGASAICPGFVSGAGMYEESISRAAKAPRPMGTTTPERVAEAVVRSVRKDLPEVIVNPNAMRLAVTVDRAFPRLAERAAGWVGLVSMLRRVAEARARARS